MHVTRILILIKLNRTAIGFCSISYPSLLLSFFFSLQRILYRALSTFSSDLSDKSVYPPSKLTFYHCHLRSSASLILLMDSPEFAMRGQDGQESSIVIVLLFNLYFIFLITFIYCLACLDLLLTQIVFYYYSHCLFCYLITCIDHFINPIQQILVCIASFLKFLLLAEILFHAVLCQYNV